MTITTTAERWTENFEVFTKEEDTLLKEVDIMEANSVWRSGLESKALTLIGIPSPIEAMQLTTKYGLDYERTMENASGFGCGNRSESNATGLILQFEELDGKKGMVSVYKNISRNSWGTLCETAKLSGSALGRMAPEQLAECLNAGLDVARGGTLLLVRHDKVMAMHSDGECGYCVMPISRLLEISRQKLEEKFGTVTFSEGRTSNNYTTALWILPDVQNDIIDKYQHALDNAVSSLHAINFMPAVRFSASDTARSSAVLKPVFILGNSTAISFGGDIAVKHEKKRGTQMFGLDLFADEATKLFAKFDETAEVIKKMAETEIFNPVNCFVGICNYLNRGNSVIPRRFADAAREEIEGFAVSSPIMSMHDIYLSMSQCIAAAHLGGVKNTTAMEEAIGKVLSLDWKAFDVGGVIAWGEKGAA